MTLRTFLTVDFMPLLAVTLAMLACGLIGNFLVLRRQSMLGDAVSHAVLPGLVIAFILTQSRAPIPMFLGAAIAGALVALCAELVRKLGRVEPGASLGAMFTIAFALGVFLLERATVGAAGTSRQVDLDADCVLYGQPEMLLWFEAPDTLAAMFSMRTLATAPHQVGVLLVVFLVILALIVLFFKELRLISFDPALASAQGFRAGTAHLVIVALVAACAVASFEAVGSILVIAALIAPAATARLCTDSLARQLLLSAIVAIICAIGGYFAGATLPGMLWQGDAVSVAGAITVTLGLAFLCAAIASPTHGLVARRLAQRRMANRIGMEDLLALLFRTEEAGHHGLARSEALRQLGTRRAGKAIQRAAVARFVHADGETLRLTPLGKRESAAIIRRHRLWETYLVEQAGVAPDHTHAPAELLEHARGRGERPIAPKAGPRFDPHGRSIPTADDPDPTE